MTSQRVAVVGGGVAGLSAAHFLEESPEFEVVLYEMQDRLGGNAFTTQVQAPNGKTYPVDPVVYLFIRPRYPYFTEWMKQLGVGTRYIPLETYLWNGRDGRGTLISSNPRKILRGGSLSPRYVRDLLMFRQTMKTIARLDREGRMDDRLKLRDFIKQVPGIDDHFINDVFYPWARFGFHCMIEEMPDKPCGALMRMFASVLKDPDTCYVIDGGVGTYVKTVREGLRSTEVRLGSAVVSVTTPATGASGWDITTAAGHREHFDHVIMAALPHHAAKMLGALANDARSDLHETVEVLSRVEMGYTRPITHFDAGLMPHRRRSWTTYVYKYDPNMRNDMTTVWAALADNVDIFVNLDTSPYPEDLLEHRTNTRPRGTLLHNPVHARPPPRDALYDARDHLTARQGRDGLWFAGSYMRETGYQEDGLHHSLDLVRSLVSDHTPLARLRRLVERVPHPYGVR